MSQVPYVDLLPVAFGVLLLPVAFAAPPKAPLGEQCAVVLENAHSFSAGVEL